MSLLCGYETTQKSKKKKKWKSIKGEILCKVDLISLKTKYGGGGKTKIWEKGENVIKDV